MNDLPPALHQTLPCGWALLNFFLLHHLFISPHCNTYLKLQSTIPVKSIFYRYLNPEDVSLSCVTFRFHSLRHNHCAMSTLLFCYLSYYPNDLLFHCLLQLLCYSPVIYVSSINYKWPSSAVSSGPIRLTIFFQTKVYVGESLDNRLMYMTHASLTHTLHLEQSPSHLSDWCFILSLTL